MASFRQSTKPSVVLAIPSRFSRRPGVACKAVASHSSTSQRSSFKRAVRAGQPTFGLFIDSASPLLAEHMAHLGYDFILVDAQHSPVDHATLGAMLTSISAAGCPSLVRVGGPEDRAGIQQALDLGANGIMVPTIKTVEDVKRVVDACYLPPLGSRSIAWPIRPQLGREVPHFLRAANEEVVVMVQIETRESFENVEEVLSVLGVDVAFMGPIDLCHALGLAARYGFPQCLESQEFQACLRRVVEACRAAGVVPGNFAVSEGQAQALLAAGYPLLATGTDVGLLEAAAKQNLAFVRRLKQGGACRD